MLCLGGFIMITLSLPKDPVTLILRLMKKWICLLLTFLMMLQSCSVYKKQSVTMDEAAAKKYKVKVTRADGSTDAFDKIDSLYYGLVKNNGEYSRTPVKESDYVKVQPKNKPVSALASIGVIVVPIVVILGVLDLIVIQ